MSAAPTLGIVDSQFDRLFGLRQQSSVPSATSAAGALGVLIKAMPIESLPGTEAARTALASLIGRASAVAFLLSQDASNDAQRHAQTLADALRECAEAAR